MCGINTKGEKVFRFGTATATLTQVKVLAVIPLHHINRAPTQTLTMNELFETSTILDKSKPVGIADNICRLVCLHKYMAAALAWRESGVKTDGYLVQSYM